MTMSEDKRIRGKVAAILSKRELVLNVGADDGVRVGTRFVILNSKGIDVRDPDSGKVLGTVEVPKTLVKVVRVDGPHICVGRTFRTVAATGFAALSSFSGSAQKVETLDIESGSSLKAELSDEDSYVKVGDTALSTEGDEYDDL
jgi:hypothetical protein